MVFIRHTAYVLTLDTTDVPLIPHGREWNIQEWETLDGHVPIRERRRLSVKTQTFYIPLIPDVGTLTHTPKV